ncbi:MAG TPA: lysophospholipid acyltransferase family protein [Rhodocyclaceae bacterium]|nr:lysophospholipid acyltransferase family protein [Rhodocyclaceae bacterium]
MWHPRTLFRLLRVALHLLQGSLTVAFFYPWLNESQRLWLKKRWSRQLLAILGVRLRYRGQLQADATLPNGLIVANHISFLDIFVVNAIVPTAFVSKDDVKSWPLIGWLSANTDTLFLERGSRNAAQRARENLAEHLKRGKRVALFPEGTTTLGDTVLPFHSALLQSAIDTGATVTPVVLSYRAVDGSRSSAPAYVDDVTLLQCLRSIADAKTLYAEVTAHAPLTSADTDRRALSAHVHRVIQHTLIETEVSRPTASVAAG